MLVAVASVKRSPGVTTFAVALAACWPAARRVVVEADGSGGDLAARFGLHPSPGLVSLAADVRSAGRPDATVVGRHTHPIGDGLFVVPAPPGAAEATGALSAMLPAGLTALRTAAVDPEALIVLDCGRLDPGAVAAPLADGADVLLVLSGARADDLAHLPSRLRSLGRGVRQRRLLLVGEGYPTAEVERELGAPVAARVPHDARAAAAMRGLGTHRHRASQLTRAAARCAHSLITHAPRTPTEAAASAASSTTKPTPSTPYLASAGWAPAPVSWPARQAAVVSGNGHRAAPPTQPAHQEARHDDHR